MNKELYKIIEESSYRNKKMMTSSQKNNKGNQFHNTNSFSFKISDFLSPNLEKSKARDKIFSNKKEDLLARSRVLKNNQNSSHYNNKSILEKSVINISPSPYKKKDENIYRKKSVEEIKHK